MQKKGATMTNFVLLIGMLLISVVIMMAIRNVIFGQTKDIQIGIYESILDTVKSSIEGAQTSPMGTQTEIKLPRSEKFTMTIENNRVEAYFPDADITLSRHFFVSKLNVIPTVIKDAASFHIVLKDSNLFIIDRLGCNTTDDVCDLGCAAERVCDPACYRPYERDVCLSRCVDRNLNNIIDVGDIDGICDPDCYNSFKNGWVYDPDCPESNDSICDPDTHMIYDSYCDNDCFGQNGVCDPDCGFYDIDCPYDGICQSERFETCENSPDCRNCTLLNGATAACKPDHPTADVYGCLLGSFGQNSSDCTDDYDCDSFLYCTLPKLGGQGHCCPKGTFFNSENCTRYFNDGVDDSDGNYGPGENCLNSPRDVQCSAGVCCPAHEDSDELGCVSDTSLISLGEGGECICTSQCLRPYTCTGDSLNDMHCCTQGTYWDDSSDLCYNYTSDNSCRQDMLPYYFETCTNSPDDCDCYYIEGPGYVCCPEAQNPTEIGCVPGNIQQAGNCTCNSQCSLGYCSNSHCCPSDMIWNGTACIISPVCIKHVDGGTATDKYDIVFIPVGFGPGELSSFAGIVDNYWYAVSHENPFSQIKDNFNIWYLNQTYDLSYFNCSQDPSFNYYWVCNAGNPRYEATTNCPIPPGDFETVVLLLNEGDWSGYREGTIGSVANDKIVITDNARRILCHELGHSFSLDDEYLYTPPEDYPSGNNAWDSLGPNCYEGSASDAQAWCDEYGDCELNLGCRFSNLYRTTKKSLMYEIAGQHFNEISVETILTEAEEWS
ncbi:hypothetical protein JW968_05195 [Candidatus Woesearchaeota archaeon]|nr:hypothetical protein [Candidatus Woesearchaeota archaeon]